MLGYVLMVENAALTRGVVVRSHLPQPSFWSQVESKFVNPFVTIFIYNERIVIILETKVCSKCGIEKPVTEFHKNGFDRQGNQKYRGYCKACACALEAARYQCKKAFIDEQRKVCAKCGDTRQYVLDYHHKDPTIKEFTIGKLKKGSLQVLQHEIDKCIVLCANCHREFHYFNKINGISIEDYLNTGD